MALYECMLSVFVVGSASPLLSAESHLNRLSIVWVSSHVCMFHFCIFYNVSLLVTYWWWCCCCCCNSVGSAGKALFVFVVLFSKFTIVIVVFSHFNWFTCLW